MEDLVQFVKDLSPCLSKVRQAQAQGFGIFIFENDWGSGTNWSFYANWDIIVCWEGSSSYLGWGCLNRSLYLIDIYHLFWRGLCFRPFWRIYHVFFPEKNDNSKPIADRHNINLCSCFRPPLTCLHHNLIHLMGSGLLNLEWIRVNLTSNVPFDYVQMYISAARIIPLLYQVSHDVEGRQKDLLNPSQRESLAQHLEQIKTLAPILICSMKIFIQILNQVMIILSKSVLDARAGKANNVIVGGERHRRGDWEPKLPRQADDRWDFRGGFFFFWPNLNLIAGDEDLGRVRPDGQHG